MAWLLGIRDVATIETHASRGALFETYIISELVKQRFNAGSPADLYFWRDNVGHEVDVLYETPNGLQAIEIKSGSTFASDWPAAVRKWQTFAGDEALTPTIIYGGKGGFERESCSVLGWRELSQVDANL
jgi:predicted AAA+ superfamily ATPase